METKIKRRTMSANYLSKDNVTYLELPFTAETESSQNENENLIHVPSDLRYHGYNYIQVYRGRRSCVYRQTYGKEIVGFEVFIIKIQPETILYGKLFKKHELWPKDGSFGKTAWSCFTLKEASEKYDFIERSSCRTKDADCHQKERRVL
jgi:hypothetical protein